MSQDKEDEAWKRCFVRLKTAQRHLGKVRFHSEVFLSDRLLYKHTSQLRRERSLQLLRRVKKLLQHIEKLDVGEIPNRLIWAGRENTEKFPPQALWEDFELVENLIVQVQVHCQKLARECQHQLSGTLFMAFHLAVLAVTSRVWALSRFASLSFDHIRLAVTNFNTSMQRQCKPSTWLMGDTPVAALSDSDDEVVDSTERCTHSISKPNPELQTVQSIQESNLNQRQQKLQLGTEFEENSGTSRLLKETTQVEVHGQSAQPAEADEIDEIFGS